MQEREQSCEARVSQHMESREEDFATLFAIASGEKECEACDGTGETDTGEECEECEACDGTGEAQYDGEALDEGGALDRIAELPLGVSVKRVMRVDLSTGGPGDWIEAELDEDGDVYDVSYHFNDWFDHAERRADPGSAIWRAAEHYAEYVRV